MCFFITQSTCVFYIKWCNSSNIKKAHYTWNLLTKTIHWTCEYFYSQTFCCLMMNKKKLSYHILWFFVALFCTTGLIFAYLDINTLLGILEPHYEITYSPAYVTGTCTQWPVYVEFTWNGIRSTITGIYTNGTYTFEFYRGTWPFTTWAAYSSGNIRSKISIIKIIDRIDNTLPAFAWVSDGVTYTVPVTIQFSDDKPGVIATINGVAFTNGWSISTNGTYQLIVKDTAGNMTWATFIVYIQDTPGWWGWWWGWWWVSLWTRRLTEDICKTRSCYSYYYDDICGTCTPPTTPVLPTDRPPYHYTNPATPNIEYSPYPKEWNDAYLRAYKLGITTESSIKNANMESLLYRKIAAKMMSEFAIKVLKIKPDESKKCEFSDIKNEIPELQYYMRLSCKLWIMGLDYYGNPDKVFNPNYFVTRDQLVTILSRALFRETFNIKHEEYTFFDRVRNFAIHTITNISTALGLNIKINTPLDWYTKHMEAIKQLWIMTNYTITLKEFKWYVMIIMYRIDQTGVDTVRNLVKKITNPS